MTDERPFYRNQHDDLGFPPRGAPDLAALSPLIGREAERKTLSALFSRASVRLLTLTGTAGVGKTRLALAVVGDLQEACAHGTHLVSLATIRDAELVLPTIAEALRIPGGPQPIFERVQAYLREQQTLLLLDNFEQVLAAAPSLSELLQTCPDLRLLVTSREALHVQGEYEFAVCPLALPNLHQPYEVSELLQNPAVALFVERARAHQSDFSLTEANSEAVAQICVRLEGLPLSLELAAARITLLSPHTLLSRLTSRLAILTSDRHDAPERQQTLRHTIQWSYDLLTADEQRLFRLVSYFVGGWTLPAVESIASTLGMDPASILDDLASLLDKSLIQRASTQQEDARLGMLETIREYGMIGLQGCGEWAQVRRAHAHYYLHLVEEHARALDGPMQEQCLQHYVRELGNLRLAMQYVLEQHDEALALRLGEALGHFWLLWGYHHQLVYLTEGQQFLEHVLQDSALRASPPYARVLSIYGLLLAGLGEGEQGEACCREALTVLRRSDHLPFILRGLWNLVQVLIVKSDYLTARPLAEEAQLLSQRVSAGSQEGEGRFLVGYSLFLAGHIALWNGRYEEARQWLETSVTQCQLAGNRFFVIWTRQLLGEVAALQGRVDEARALLEESKHHFSTLGMTTRVAAALRFLGGLALLAGQIDEASAYFLESHKLGEAVQDPQSVAWAQISLAKVKLAQQQLSEAQHLLEDCLQQEIARRDRFVRAASLEWLAGIISIQGERERAAQMWGAAQALREAAGTPMLPAERPVIAAWMAQVRTALGEARFQTNWAQGYHGRQEQAHEEREEVQVRTASASHSLQEDLRATTTVHLTAREREVLRLLCEGLTNKEIARRLGLSHLTINSSLRFIYSKLGVSSRTQAMHMALERHLL